MGRARLATVAAAGAVLATLGLVVSGCGSSGSAAASASTTTTAAAGTTTNGTATNGNAGARAGFNSAAFAAYQSCLKSHGVTLNAGQGFGGGGFGRGRAGGVPPTGTGATPPTATAPTGTTPTGTNGRRPGGFPGGFGRTLTAKQRAAMQACQNKLPTGARGGFRRGGAGGAGGANPAFAKYTACLAKHGVKLGTSAAGSTTFAKAQAACRSLLPTPGGGGTGTTTTTG